MALASREANDIAANSRKKPLGALRRLQKRYVPTTGGRKRNLLRTIFSPGRCSLLGLQAGIERWESYVSRCETKLKSKLHDEIKLAGLEALVPEQLEKLILNANRLRTFGEARLEIVTSVEAKVGQRIRDARRGETCMSCTIGSYGRRCSQRSLIQPRKKASTGPHGGCFKCGGAHSQRDCTARKGKSKQSSGRGMQSSKS